MPLQHQRGEGQRLRAAGFDMPEMVISVRLLSRPTSRARSSASSPLDRDILDHMQRMADLLHMDARQIAPGAADGMEVAALQPR